MKILIAGLGGVGQRHLRNLRFLLQDEVEIIAYRVRGFSHVITETFGIETGTTVEEKYNVRSFYDLDVALAEEPDATLVCGPNNSHVPIAIAATKSGSNVFIEKPLSNNLTGIDQLDRVLSESGLVGIVGYQLRFHPALRRIRQLLQSRAFGNLIGVYATIGEYMPAWHPYEDYRSLYAARAELGGGVILSQIHELDYLYWLFGMPHRIFALGGHKSRLEIDVEDTASILMDVDFDGARIPIHIHEDFVQRPPSRTLTVIGDAGKAFVDFAAPCLKVFGEDGNLAEENSFPGFQRNQLFLDEMKHFLNCITGSEQPLISISEGAQSLRIAVAAKESIETGRVVELN